MPSHQFGRRRKFKLSEVRPWIREWNQQQKNTRTVA
jgi:hypothetical protein